MAPIIYVDPWRGDGVIEKPDVNHHRIRATSYAHPIIHKYYKRLNKNPCNSIGAENDARRIGVFDTKTRSPFRHELSALSLSVVLCARFEKNDLFGNMSALYIVMEHTSGKRHRALSATFFFLPLHDPLCTSASPRSRSYSLPFSLGAALAYAGNIYFYYNHLPRVSPESTDFLSSVRIDPDTLAASRTFPEINKSGKFELFPSFLLDVAAFIYAERIFSVINGMDLIFAFHKNILCFFFL